MAKASKEDIATLQMLLEVQGDEYKINHSEANAYLVTNRNNVIAAYDEAFLQREIQRLAKPQRKPSKKKVLPSPSSIIDPDLGLLLDDYERALLNSLEDTPPIENEASQMPFEEWIDRLAPSELSPLRAKLLDLFNGRGWNVVDPRGDGFCGLYIAAIDFQNKSNADPQVLARVLEVQRDGLIELIIDGVKKYYEARDRHIALRIRIPDELDDNKYFNIDDRADADGNISPNNFILTHELLLTNEELIREKLRILEHLANTPESVFKYLPYIYKRNYLILAYDSFRGNSPFTTTFMPCYADVVIDAYGNALYPYNEFTNSALMFNNGHYFLLNNPDTTIKAQLVSTILENKLSDVPIRLWQERYAEGIIRKRKHKAITYKARTHKARTRKARTHKPRTHRSLRRKAIKQRSKKQ